MTTRAKRTFAAFASSILLAASPLIAAPASAQESPEPVNNYNYQCYDVNGGGGPYPYGAGGYGCCQYDEAWGGWYIMYVTHWEPCNPYVYYSPEPGDRPSLEPGGQ